MQPNTIIIIFAFIIIFALLIFFSTKQRHRYTKRVALLSSSELRFYKFLLHNLPKKNTIMIKVRLADIVTTTERGRREIAAFNKIKSKHIDFVVIDSDTSEIRVAIELNDISHLRPSRIVRDAFIKELFNQAGLAFYQVKCKNSYSLSDIQFENII